MEIVAYVQSKDGKPLMPMHSYPRVRRFIKSGRAVIINQKPLILRLTYDIKEPVIQTCHLGQDPGRTNIGVSVILDNGSIQYSAHIETSNKDVPKHMAERKMHRQASRHGERKRRQRRAIKNGTTFKKSKSRDRILPCCSEPITNNYIINTEARFANRKREKGWLTPTARHLLGTLIRTIELAEKLLPIFDITVELNKWDFEKLKNPGIQNWGYGTGPLKGHNSVNDAVYDRQNGICLLCRGKIERYHHVIPKHLGGNDNIDNIAGLCTSCHNDVHTKDDVKNKLKQIFNGMKKQYAALSIMNQVLPHYIKYLVDNYSNVYITDGKETAKLRQDLNLPKDHHIDAWCIAATRIDINNVSKDTLDDISNLKHFEIKQFRRQNRAIINNQRERTYKFEGKTVARNRKPRFEQKGDSLESWFNKQVKQYGIETAERMRSQLKAIKSTRYYNNEDRIMPGAIFIYKGKRYVLSGQLANGAYYRAVGHGKQNFPARDCKILIQNTGFVYL